MSIDPGTRYWGVSVFSGEVIILLKVLHLSMKDASQENRLSMVRKTFHSLCDRYTPQILVMKDPYGFWKDQSAYLGKIIEEIKRLAKKRYIRIVEYPPTTIRKTLCQDEGATKEDLAQAIGRFHPELREYLEHKQKNKNKYWRLVNSLALGACYLKNVI